MATNPSDPHLQKFPRPANDNGRGLHFVLDARADDLDKFTAWLQHMQMRWSTVYGGDELVTVRAAKALQDVGVMSVLRIQATGEKPKAPGSWAGYVRHALAEGVTPYFQIFNEPEDGREGFDSPEHFAVLWGQRATAVVEAGGYPGLQVLSEDFLRAVAANASAAVKERMFFVLHNYGANHPPQYPYPNATAMQDDTTVLRFLAIAEWCKTYFGFVPPMLGGEGGWLFQNADDTTMPPVHIEQWVAWHLEMYGWFRSGMLSNGEPLPDYLFSVCPWLLYASNWYSDSWIYGLHAAPEFAVAGENPNLFKSDLIDALARTTPFVRQFGGTSPTPEPEPEPEPLPEPVPEGVIDPRAYWVRLADAAGAHVQRVYFYDSKQLAEAEKGEADGRVDIIVMVLNQHGHTVNHAKVTLKNGGVVSQWTRIGYTDFPMSGDSSFDPNRGERGPYTVECGGAMVTGLGLPLKQHVQYLIEFVLHQ